jgi:hypothetical protein
MQEIQIHKTEREIYINQDKPLVVIVLMNNKRDLHL